MVSEASRGRYDFDNLYRQSNQTNWKNDVIRSYWKPLELDLKLKIQLLAEFCHPSCDMKFADPLEKFESLCFKPTTQRNLKHKAPCVRALAFLCCKIDWMWKLGLNLDKIMSNVKGCRVGIVNLYQCEKGQNSAIVWTKIFVLNSANLDF